MTLELTHSLVSSNLTIIPSDLRLLIHILYSSYLSISAPTNDAFYLLPEGNYLLLPENKALLTDLLLYHVLTKEYLAPPGLLESTLPVLKEGNFKYATAMTPPFSYIRPSELKVRVDGTTVLAKGYADVQIVDEGRDVFASNGIIHVINEVIANIDIMTVCRRYTDAQYVSTVY